MDEGIGQSPIVYTGGITHHDLPDADYRGYFDDGISVKNAIKILFGTLGLMSKLCNVYWRMFK